MDTERREAERYSLKLAVVINAGDADVTGFTENVSARGVLLSADTQFSAGSLEFIITFPPEITFSTHLKVRCNAKVARRLECSASNSRVAVHIQRYEFLSKTEQQ